MRRGTIERRNGSWSFRVSWQDDAGKRHHTRRQGFATKRDAETAMTAVLSQIDAGHNLGTAKGTVETFLVSWLAAYDASGTVKRSTQVATRLHVEKYLVPRLGGLQLRQLNAARISNLYVDLLQNGRTGAAATSRKGQGLSPKTVKNIAGTLHKALSDAVRLGVLQRNPADGVDLPRWQRPELRVWSVDQVATFLDYVERNDPYSVAWWRLLLVAGLRRGEIMGLKWENVDLVEGHVQVRQTRITTGAETRVESPKSQSGRRTVAVDADTVTALAHLKNAQEDAAAALGAPTGPYVVTDPDGLVPVPQTLTKRFRRLTQAAGLPVIRLHDARHTHVSQLIDSGVPLTAIAARVGHSRASFTLDTYGHLLPNADRQAADAVSRSISAALDAARWTRNGRGMDAELPEQDGSCQSVGKPEPLSDKDKTNPDDRGNGAGDGNRTRNPRT